MSLQTALQVVGLLAVGYLVFVGLLAMGPIGWVVFVPMLLIGSYQVYRERSRRSGAERGSDERNSCPNCGSTLDIEAFETTDESDADGDDDRQVRYCSTCGTPLETVPSSDPAPSFVDDRSGADTGRSNRVTNCPDCGAPNDPHRTTCEYCDAEL